MQVFVNKEEFQTHIKKDGYALDKIEEKLKVGKDDVLKTECPIVIAGEHMFNSLYFSGKKPVIIYIIRHKQICKNIMKTKVFYLLSPIYQMHLVILFF